MIVINDPVMLTEDQVQYIRSPEFRLRAERTYRRIADGEPMCFQQLADEWELPLTAAVAGFQIHMARSGLVFVPNNIPSPISAEWLQVIADAALAGTEPRGHA